MRSPRRRGRQMSARQMSASLMSGAPGGGRFAGVRKIAVFRPNAVGDFVFALPALHALKRAYPDAELVLLGLPWHAAFLEGRPGPVDRVIAVPPMAGVGLPPDVPDGGAAQRFVRAMRGEGFDIACQMYGGGRYSNPLVASFGARLTIGFRADGAPPLDRCVRHAEPNNRRLALLEVAALAGACEVTLGQELAVTPADRDEAARVLSESGAGPVLPPLVLLQPGSTDPRRCWPAASFAAVGDALARMGAQVAVNGTAAEAPLVGRVTDAMEARAIDLSGKLGLGGLCALIEGAACVVSNDTGPLHLALAIGTPAVGMFWLTNLIDGTPLRQGLLRAALSLRQECPECGAPNLSSRCAHDASFVADVPVGQVVAMAAEILHARRGGVV
ncbi:MAG: glycosyltransferase family 9 protein [Massilia sp.]|nr:glycosyltransferase family 9 protein [Massilia sp.]